MSDCSNDIVVGPYRGLMAEEYSSPEFISCLLAELPSPESSQTDGTSFQRNRVVSATLRWSGRDLDVSIKSFGRQSLLKGVIARMTGSAARRSWLVALALARQGVGTPRPIGFLERWDGLALRENYFLSEHQRGMTTFRDELIRLYTEDPICAKVMALLECVARAVRRMHDAGIIHGDMGNQNILLRRTVDQRWEDTQFVDLNRGRILEDVPLRGRAFDVSRVALPSDFLRVFKEMYFADVQPPRDFQRWESHYRRLFAWHTATRRWRHPLRWAGQRRAETDGGTRTYPAEKDIWVWDDRSVQAVGALTARDRRRLLSWRSHIQIAAATAAAALPVWREYKLLMRRCYRNPVALRNRVGMAVNPEPANWDRERQFLDDLGRIPVIIRFYHHQSREQASFAAQAGRRLAESGHSVSAALVQDRRAVLEPRKWTSFVEGVLGAVADYVDWVEIGHAVNRSKWGIWDIAEHIRLLQASAEACGRYPHVRLMGPAAIDFEYPFVLAALRHMPKDFRFSALSHLLYVDRRGAPENRQGPFAALEKFALAKAIAGRASGCEGRVIVSETNWPLLGTGVFSPVGSPYVSPGTRLNDPSVSEQEYSDYMLRYLVQALCSGMVERVYWWRLVARGFGLVDDSDTENWRPRPAYHSLRFFLSTLSESTFIGKLPSPDGVGLLKFALPGGKMTVMAYASRGTTAVSLPFSFSEAVDACGKGIVFPDGEVSLSGSPVYFLDAKPS